MLSALSGREGTLNSTLDESMLTIVRASSIKTQLDVEEIKGVISKTHVKPAFEEIETVDGMPQIHNDGEDGGQPVRTWLGHILRERHSDRYLLDRDELSNAAFEGRWGDMFQMLDRGRRKYGETWANAIRLSKRFVVLESVGDVNLSACQSRWHTAMRCHSGHRFIRPSTTERP